MAKIYKYFSNDMLELVFQRKNYCGVKCSLPKDYNDPYELFLGMDLNTPPEHLAFYRDVVSDTPQIPTTCFSKSPIVSPMWAHYAKNHTGFVLEFDLDALQVHFEGNPIWDVSYRETPYENLKHILQHAAVLKKPRYAYDLQRYVFIESYFTKYKEWAYEEECRFVDMKDVTEIVSGNNILYIPSDFITAVIVGPKFSKECIPSTLDLAEKYNLNWYELVIGKSHPKPYLRNTSKQSYIYHNEIIEAEYTCQNCSEPLIIDSPLCPWCSITEAHEIDAAKTNPFRMLNSIGELENYIKGMNAIHKR